MAPARLALGTLMLPIIPVLGVVVWLLVRNNKSGQPMSPGGRTLLFKGLALLVALLLTAVLWPLALPYKVAAGVLGAGMLVLALPTFFIRAVAVPLGWPRLAHAMAVWLYPVQMSVDRRGNAVLFGALALARCPRSPRTLATLAWLEERLRREPTLHGAGLVALGLLMALRGEAQQARSLLWWAHRLPQQVLPSRPRAEARQWLVAHAVGQGRWDEAAHLGLGHRRVPGWSRGVATMAARLAGVAPVPSNGRLWWAWLSSGQWRACWPLLQRGLAAPLREADQAVADEPMTPAGLPQALRQLAHALGAGAQDATALVHAVAVAGAAFESASTRAHIDQMAAASAGAGRLRPSTDAVLMACRERLAGLIEPLLERSPQLAAMLTQRLAPGGAAVVEDAVRRVRDRMFADIEAQCADYLKRRAAQDDLEALVEHRLWARVRDTADRLLALHPQSQNAVFHAMFAPVCNFAAFLHNDRKQALLACEMFSWLHIHARDNPEAQALLGRNVELIAGRGQG